MLFAHAMREAIGTALYRLTKARWRIGRFFGVLFTINYSLVVVPITLAVYCYPDVRLFFALMSFCVGIAASVVFHEICHAGAGRCVGRAASEIGLLPIGGYTLFEESPGEGWTALFVSLAGPLGNCLVCVFLVALEMGLLNGEIQERFSKISALMFCDDIAIDNLPFLVVWANAVLRINVMLAVFNLVPISSLDGGRCLRILLAYLMPRHHAIATSIYVSRMIVICILAYTLVDVIFGTEGIVDNAIALSKSALVWCMSDMGLMRAKPLATIGSQENSVVDKSDGNFEMPKSARIDSVSCHLGHCNANVEQPIRSFQHIRHQEQ